MKKLIYLTAVAGSLLLTTSCVDLTQEHWKKLEKSSM